MKPTELRIGNWVKDEDKILQINAGHFHYAGWFEHIPLTEEWLKKLGFEYCDDPDFDKWASAKMYFKGYLQIGAYRLGEGSEDYIVKHPAFLNGNPINHVMSVHQLQNLYFALTGEELEIK